MSTVRPFGQIGDAPILDVGLSGPGGLAAQVITWGGVLRTLTVPGRNGPQPVVLGLDTLDDYVAYSPFFGATVGRYANRIGRARFRLGGREIDLVPNENGNELHGGPGSFGRRPWSLLAAEPSRVHLALVSEDGDMGYPGRLFATCSYELLAPATLRISLCAFADAPTPVNLTTHNYFNLDDAPDVRDHIVSVEADFTTPTDPGLVPTGAIAPVDGTRFDFRRPRPIRTGAAYETYDANFVIRRERSPDPVLARAATVFSPVSGVRMELWTTEPGLQLYDGHLIDVPVRGTRDIPLRAFSGLALETQRFPDAPNHAHFPPCTLSPGEVSRQITELRFSTA